LDRRAVDIAHALIGVGESVDRFRTGIRVQAKFEFGPRTHHSTHAAACMCARRDGHYNERQLAHKHAIRELTFTALELAGGMRASVKLQATS
jgi:hypothetical protein